MTDKYKYFNKLCGLSLLSFTMISSCFLQDAESAEVSSAKTSLVVIDAEFVKEHHASPSEVIDYRVTHYLNHVNYTPGLVAWNWGPLPGYSAWRPGSTPLTARIWAWKTNNGGKTYEGLGWDYILNTTTFKHRANDVPGWVGTMMSSLCHTNATCNATERTPIVFFPSLSSSVAGDGFRSFTISPKDVGAFYQNKTQQFKAIAVTTAGVVLDLTNKVDWYIDPEGAPYTTSSQDMTKGAIATIGNTGKASINSTWGRVMVHACYPKGCGPNSSSAPATGVLPAVNLLILNQ
ncbi:hypothetical protein JYT85_01860 [Desulfocapsa sp. AH-315-G09]|nr:hypothetical protein [Desulfocapsa sp.]MBN4065374.1 hypothetical protein [Desulfocapsa sp. AH-315-G09]